MRIQISSVTHTDDTCKVKFTSLYGHGEADWADEQPTLWVDYDVEIMVGETLRWGDTIYMVKHQQASISQDGAALVLCGYLEQIDSTHHLGILRLGADALVMFTYEGVPPELSATVETQLMHPMLNDQHT